MAQWAKALVTKSDNLHFIFRTHMVEREMTSAKGLLTSMHVLWHAVPPKIHMQSECNFTLKDRNRFLNYNTIIKKNRYIPFDINSVTM